jgi:alkylresorcinol/alkylpyrone synthase
MAGVTSTLLRAHDLEVSDVVTWIAHSGGPKVLTALELALELDPSATELTWRSLREVGNLSSASVLDVLRRTMEVNPSPRGDPAVVVAMGPGFCAELVLLEW